MEKISIIVPVYNTAKLIEKCILSICNQTYQNLEIVCVDDGSTDGSGEILDDLARKDSRIIVIHQENKGESFARNSGLEKSSGNYIGFMDCDDWIEPDMYEMLMAAMLKYNVDLVASGWYKDSENASERIINKEFVNEEVFGRDKLLHYVYERDRFKEFAYIWDKLYRRDILKDDAKQFIHFDENLVLGGDVLYLAQVVLNTTSAVFINKAFYHYFQRMDSGIHTNEFKQRKDHLIAYLKVIDLFEQNNISEEILIWVKRFLAYHSSVIAKITYNQKDKEGLLYCQNLMKRFQAEYISTNQKFPERIQEFNRIINYKI